MGVALIAGLAAVISLQRGDLVLTVNDYEIRSTAAVVIGLLVLYSAALVILTRIWTFVFRRAPKRKEKNENPSPAAATVKATDTPPYAPRFVDLPQPLDAAPPGGNERK